MTGELCMSLQQAEAVVMPFGKYKGRNLGEIAKIDLLYLDWLVGKDIRSDRLALALTVICEGRHREIVGRVEGREQ